MKIKRSLFFIGLTALLFSCSSSESQNTNSTPTKLKEEITELDSLNNALDNTASEIDNKIKALDEALKDLE